jgi:hypothetical protein
MPYVAIANAFFPWHYAVFTQGGQRLNVMIVALLILFIIVLSIVKKPAVLFIILLSLSGLFYIFTFTYPGALRHHGLVLIVLLFALWIGRHYPDSQNKLFSGISIDKNLVRISMAVLNVCLALALIYSLRVQSQEYEYIFSGAKEMAEFIKRNNLDTNVIIAHPSPQASALLPYLPGKKFWYAGMEDYGTFVAYNKKLLDSKAISNLEVISRMRKTFPHESKKLLLLGRPLNLSESNGFELLYKVDNVFGYNGERYYLYKPVAAVS